jgi:hypothetical protein
MIASRRRGLAGLAVADDQLALAAADRDHRVDRLDAGLQRLVTGWRSDLLLLRLAGERLDLVLQDRGHLGRSEFHLLAFR